MKYIALCLIAALSAASAQAASFLGKHEGSTAFTPVVGDEFVGPFANWINAKTGAPVGGGAAQCTGATGNGSTDDTTAIQSCLTNIGSGVNNSVLWFPAGTYKITSTINLQNHIGVSLYCEAPSTTKIIWGGAAGGKMIQIDGTAYSHFFNRCSIDGGLTNHAGTGINETDVLGGNFDTTNEYSDMSFTHLDYDLQCGFTVDMTGQGNGCAEISIQRNHFLSPTYDAVTLGNFNALDIWIRWNEFDHVGYDSITNQRNGTFSGGAGNFRSYYNIFRNTGQYDHAFNNLGTFSVRGNYSIGGWMFYLGGQGVTQNNTILDWRNGGYGPGGQGAIYIAGGAYNSVFYGNTFRPPIDAINAACISVQATDWTSVFYTNTVATCNPIYYNGIATQHPFEIDDHYVSRGSINPTEPTLPPTQTNYGRTIFELPPGSSQSTVQTAINSADALHARAVVHIQNQTININGTSGLSVPANSDIQIICDGYSGVLKHQQGTGTTSPMLKINGPTKVRVSECYFDADRYGGDGGVRAMVVTNLDQPGATATLQSVVMNDGAINNVLFDQMDHTVVHLRDSQLGYYVGSDAAARFVGGPHANSGSPDEGAILWHSGSMDIGPGTKPLDCANNALVVLRDFWVEGNATNQMWFPTGSCRATLDGWHFNTNTQLTFINLASWTGKLTLIGQDVSGGDISISGNGTGTNFLSTGLQLDYGPLAPSPFYSDTSSPAANTYTFSTFQGNSAAASQTYAGPVGTQQTTAFVESMMATALATKETPPQTTPPGVSDLRLYRIQLQRGNPTSLHLCAGSC